MQAIIDKIDRKILKEELAKNRFVRYTNNGNNEIYIITHHDSPNVMLEIGRLREFSFRYAGGGTGKSVDIDHFDTSEHCYKQLLVWNPTEEEIVGAYRYIKCKDAQKIGGKADLATTELFHFSPLFYEKYFNETIELGRSFVQPAYQPAEHFRKGIFSLDNLWDGLGALVVDNNDINYFFGKVTIFSQYKSLARDLLLTFLHHYFPDPDLLVVPVKPVDVKSDVALFKNELKTLAYKDGLNLLNKNIRAVNENIPPLVNAYMNLSSTMKTFGTAINEGFGEVDETGIMIYIPDIYETKKARHINSYRALREGSLK